MDPEDKPTPGASAAKGCMYAFVLVMPFWIVTCIIIIFLLGMK